MIDFQHFTVKLSESHISGSQFQSLQLKHTLHNFERGQKAKTNTEYDTNKAISVEVMTDHTPQTYLHQGQILLIALRLQKVRGSVNVHIVNCK